MRGRQCELCQAESAVLPARTPAGRPVRRGPAVSTFHEILALVVVGDVVCTVPDEGRRYNAQSDVAFLPLHDAPPVEWALIWRTDSVPPLVGALAEAATDRGDVGARTGARQHGAALSGRTPSGRGGRSRGAPSRRARVPRRLRSGRRGRVR
ncbi:LysR substrate-binding domain-containing protein [Streptomyces sp. CB03578]|uniref:LysR substrate-binding domain-containing protein n=1 Tax=Streptomyces sp. CB03578 TaxID=1718987 RepID=UPI003FA7C452